MTVSSSRPWLRPISKSLGSCAGRDLQRAGAELGLDVLVGDDLQAAADDRQDHGLPHQPLVAVVVRVDGDRGVAQHRLGAHGGDGDRAVAGRERVVDVVEGVGGLAVLDLEVGDGRPRARVPVDHVVVAVDQALLVQRDEDLQHRADVVLVQREALFLVVARGAEALVLLDDRAAVLLAPAPHALGERLAADLLARGALGLEQALDLRLRGDAGVVGAQDPLRPLAAHAVVADQRVLDRAVERVPHVQRAGDVRRRDRDRVVLGRRSLRFRVEPAGVQPAGEDAFFALTRVIARAILEPHSAVESRRPRSPAPRRRGVGRGTGPRRCPPGYTRGTAPSRADRRGFRPRGRGSRPVPGPPP